MNTYFHYFNRPMRLLISRGCTDDAYLVDMMAKGIAMQKACIAASAAAEEEKQQLIAEITKKKQIILDDMKSSLERFVLDWREVLPVIRHAKFKEDTADGLDETTYDVRDLTDAYEEAGGAPELIKEARALFSLIFDITAARRAERRPRL